MWRWCSERKAVAAMASVLTTAALVALIVATRGGGKTAINYLLVESDDIEVKRADIFTATRLPTDNRFMASIGNGHVATNVFSDIVYMNGLYNGASGESHRARIPGWANVRIAHAHPHAHVAQGHAHATHTYSLDTTAGAFIVRVDRERSHIEHRVYAHRFYTRAIINQIQITAKHYDDVTVDHQIRRVDLTFQPGENSSDISFERPKELFIDRKQIWEACGKTKVLEDDIYQEKHTPVCAFWTNIPDHLLVPKHGIRTQTFVMTVDSNREVALKELQDVLQETHEILYRKHRLEWAKLYNDSRIYIEGNDMSLAKMVNGMWYYLLSSLPSDNTNQPQGLFYGLSPGSLARGDALFDDYEGHNFWDTEIWMFPPILLSYPRMAERLLRYRMEMASAAADLARQTGNAGTRYPWESAFTGQEVTQPCCPEMAEFEHHVTGCIAFAIRQYLAVTRDEHWLKSGGCSVVTNIAKFWASRLRHNKTSGFNDISQREKLERKRTESFFIRDVMGPDEDHSNVTNSAFTNVVAGYSLYLAQYVSCLCKSFFISEDPDHFADLAWNLELPYDKKEDYHPQFNGYKKPEKIKQADVVLLGFPLQYPMKRSTRENDLSYYENVTRVTGPAMTWGMHAVGHLRLGDPTTARRYFYKSYAEHVREPFKVWSELKRPSVGAVNFMTGMGGLLQALLFGYAGLSIHMDRMEIHNPQLPPDTDTFRINGIKYLGASMNLDINGTQRTLKIVSVDSNRPLEISLPTHSTPLTKGKTIYLSGKGPFVIRTTSPNSCPLPLDIIGRKGKRPRGRN